MNLKDIHVNPENPRIIKDERFKKLCKSIKEFPKMMTLRPIIIDNEGMILGGNMRFKALLELGYKDVPDEWVRRAETLTEDEKRRFIIEDNLPFGEWDWESLKEWDREQLEEWGLEIPAFIRMPEFDELTAENKNKPAIMKITFPTPEDLQNCENEIQEVINRICPKAYYSVSAGEL